MDVKWCQMADCNEKLAIPNGKIFRNFNVKMLEILWRQIVS
jgi:hypothetical protein